MCMKPGAEPTPGEVALCLERERRLLARPRDCTLIGRCAGVAIWQTEKTAANDLPWWIPPFNTADRLYRGFLIDHLPAVLETGLDVPSQSAFFASTHGSKAWEYPLRRESPAMLVLDPNHTQPSYLTAELAETGVQIQDDYPHRYRDGAMTIHTRFEPGRCHSFTDEIHYGHWIPGNARAALFAVVLGGPHAEILGRLRGLKLSSAHRIMFV